MRAFTLRNLRLYFRDTASVFFSMLAVIIILVVYLLFLGNVWTQNLPNMQAARAMMNYWILAGLLAVTSLTTTMGAFGTMVEDKHRRLIKDFQASPISAARLMGGYVLSSYIVGVIMSALAFVLAELYMLISGAGLLPPMIMLRVLGLILLSTLCNTAMVFLLVSFFKTNAAFSTASTILGTLIGFLAGIYMPVGMLPGALQAFIKVFPVSHAAALFRQAMMGPSMQAVFAGAPSQTLAAFQSEMGVYFQWGAKTMPPLASVLIILCASALFFLLCVLRIAKKRG